MWSYNSDWLDVSIQLLDVLLKPGVPRPVPAGLVLWVVQSTGLHLRTSEIAGGGNKGMVTSIFNFNLVFGILLANVLGALTG